MTARAQLVDVVRGLALVAMISYHACWFAADGKLVVLDLQALGWRIYQWSIAGTFLLLVGVSLVLARGGGAGRIARRLLKIGAAALVVTVTSVVLDPGRVVTFGILHNIALSSLLAQPVLGLGGWNLVLGSVLVAIPTTVHVAPLSHPLLSWTGLGPRPGAPFDYQPLLPWFGVVLWGVALGTLLVGPRGTSLLSWKSSSAGARALALLGRHSLFVYMAHVPILLLTVTLLHRVLK